MRFDGKIMASRRAASGAPFGAKTRSPWDLTFVTFARISVNSGDPARHESQDSTVTARAKATIATVLCVLASRKWVIVPSEPR